MRLIWKVTMLAAVPLLVLGQDADSGDDDDDAAPKARAAAGLGPYETILKRMPFGPLPPNFHPDAPPGTAAGVTAYLVAHARGKVADFDVPFTNCLPAYSAPLARTITLRAKSERHRS